MKKSITPKKLAAAKCLLTRLLNGEEFTEKEISDQYGYGGSRLIDVVRYEPLWVPVPDARKGRIYRVMPEEIQGYFDGCGRKIQEKKQRSKYYAQEHVKVKKKLHEISGRNEASKSRILSMVYEVLNELTANDDPERQKEPKQ
ncbi:MULTISPECIES: hypothetical protein [unclassified Shewanella]|uniref:hypothetical protein n=1 Tax=unclassified Shewanella TaxID=196818 RepID=UPI000C85E6CE|nr:MULTISPECIES: hypothetical protein [unclassified Shewanella]MDO6679390.1 hypothetical protein [Shewanella sp. 4_MG-2023]PMG51490.1 hypothetical protein BCU91_16520 [Shewanella sp. 10N.286.52.B9]